MRPRRPIVCVGGLMHAITMRVDSIPGEGETVLGFEYEEPYDGGKAADYAVCAVRLGAEVALVTVVGNDDRGAHWREQLAREGIDTSAVWTLDGPTDVGLALLPNSAIPAMVSICDLTWRMTPELIADASDLLGTAALTVASLECRPEAVAAAFELARSGGARTILNAAPALALPGELLDATDVLVVNEHEAAIVAGRDGGLAELAGALSELLPGREVVVTAGEDGAYLQAPGAELAHFPAPAVTDVVDTSGAGDAFVGALAVRLWHGESLADAVAYGVRVASFTVTAKSTMPSYPTAAELDVATS
jgi:ribokinase